MVLDQLTAPVPISASARGIARDIRRRIAAEDIHFEAAAKKLIEPISSRLHRYPTRAPRPEMLAGLVKDWHDLPAIDWRLNVSAELEKTRCAVTERRLQSAGVLRSKDWAEGEPDIAVIEVALSIDQHRQKLRTRCLCTLSMHAISRRVQRHSDASETAILCDIAIAAEAAAGDASARRGLQDHDRPGDRLWMARPGRSTAST